MFISLLLVIISMLFTYIFWSLAYKEIFPLGKINKKILFKILMLLSIATLFIALPFFIEDIILNEDTFPFNVSIYFDKEIWFGFMASYIGAICTIALGIISLYQNKKYKELADLSAENMNTVLDEIKKTIWLNNLPVTRFDLTSIQQENKKELINTMANHWSHCKADGNVHLKFLNEHLDASNSQICLFRVYSIVLENLSDFPVQQIKGIKLSLRKADNAQPIKLKAVYEALQGYIDANSKILCKLEVYDLYENFDFYSNDILEIMLTIEITDAKGYSHHKIVKVVSVNSECQEHLVKWYNCHMIYTDVKEK